jgi:hypothetical protein
MSLVLWCAEARAEFRGNHSPTGIVSVLRSREDIPSGDVMKRIAGLMLLGALSVAWSTSAYAQRENRSIGENSREARKAAKQQQKASKKIARKQRKAMKKYQKAQRKSAKQQRRPK